ADVFDPPTQYGYDGKPLDASFCRTAGSREKDCRKDVQACDKKYDDQGRETACAKGIREKYKPAVVYGYDGKPLDLGFCTLAGIREVDCRKDAQTCDKKYESDKCLNAIKEKYKPVVDPNPPA
nr:Chain A, Cellophane-induced protein 1 [Venturia inaequalis]